jgi:hypothetical protein
MYNLTVERGDLVRMVHRNFVTGEIREIMGIYLGIRRTRWSPDDSLVYVTVLTPNGIKEELASAHSPDERLEVLQRVKST